MKIFLAVPLSSTSMPSQVTASRVARELDDSSNLSDEFWPVMVGTYHEVNRLLKQLDPLEQLNTTGKISTSTVEPRVKIPSRYCVLKSSY